MKTTRFVLTVLLFVFCLPVSESAIKAPILEHKNTIQTALVCKKWKLGRLEKTRVGLLRFHKKLALPKRSDKITGLEIIMLAMLAITAIVAVFVRTIPSALATAVVVLFVFTLLLALIGLLRKKKEGRSKDTFWAVFGGGVASALLMYLFATYVAD